MAASVADGSEDTGASVAAGSAQVGPPAGGVRYATDVVAIGELIPAFREQGLLVYFAELAPQELHEFVVLHRPTVAHSVPEPGDVVEIDGTPLTITAVGSVVAENLLRLGHFSLKADGATQAPMPGDVCVEKGDLPLPADGGTMRILVANPLPDAVQEEGS